MTEPTHCTATPVSVTADITSASVSLPTTSTQPNSTTTAPSNITTPALRVGGRRVSTTRFHTVAANHDKADWMFDRDEFSRLSVLYGPFTMDAAADCAGNNAHVTSKFCSPDNSFFETDCSGNTVWCNPPFDRAADFIAHYLTCKNNSSSTTSAVFVLPKWRNVPWSALTAKMQLVHEYPVRMQLFTKPVSPGSASRVSVGPAPWSVQVFYDPPNPIATNSPLTATPDPPPEPLPLPVSPLTEHLCMLDADNRTQLLVLPGRHKGYYLRVLVDSGASRDFISATTVARLKLAPRQLSTALRVRLADGTMSTTALEVSLPLTLGSHSDCREYIVTNIECYDVILGKPWLADTNPAIDWAANKITSPFQLSGSGSVNTQPTIQHIRAKPMARLLRKKDTYLFLATLTTAPSPPPDPPPDFLSPETCLSPPAHSKFLGLLQQFKQRFTEPSGVHVRSGVYHTIPLKDGAKLPQQHTRRMSPAELEEVQKQIKWYLERGWIRPSDSPFGAPIVFAKKADGTLRMCTDYRALNAITKKSHPNLPRIDEALDQLEGARYFTSLDLASGYHQVPMAPEDVHKTAFATRYGNYEFTVMPFGLTSAPHTFQALMNSVLRPFIDKFCLVYLDDIMIYSKSEEEHLEHLRLILTALEAAKLHIKPSKCKFAKSSTVFLGFQVSRDGISVDPKKVAAIQDWPLPTNITAVRSFLGFAGFYRRFIQNFSTIAAPLTALTSATKPFPLSLPLEAVDSFHRLKSALSSAPVLALPITGPDATFELYTDASQVGVGGVLEQDGHPICFESRKLNPAEQNYPIHELELLAVVHCLRAFRHYLEGCKQFRLFTDHQSIKYIFTQKDLSRRQARWLGDLATFQSNMEIAYKPGAQNHADALSRVTVPLQIMTGFTISSDTLLSDIKSAYAADPYYSDSKRPSYLRLHAGLWHFRDRVCVPNSPSLRQRILSDYHDAPSAGHPGSVKTLTAIGAHFWWPQMSRTVRAYVTSCATCQRTKPSSRCSPGLLQPHTVPSRPWSHISMDLITDLPPSTAHDGKVYDSIATFVDLLTKQAFFVRTNKTVTAQGLAHLYLDNVYRLKGLSHLIISDRDTRITAEFWQTLFSRLGTTLNMSTAHHPQTDGQTEITHRTIEQILRAYVDPHHDDWATWLPVAEFAYNNATHSTTTVSPFLANYGYSPSTPATLSLPTSDAGYATTIRDLHQLITQLSNDAKVRQADYANRSRRELQFKVGDRVRLTAHHINLASQPSAKLRHRFLGPFSVSEVVSPVAYRLTLPSAMSRMHPVFHVSRLLPWHDNDPLLFPNRSIPAQPIHCASDYLHGDDVYEVDHILDCDISDTTLRLKVRWAAPYSDPKFDTWEPASQLHRLDAFRTFVTGPKFTAFTATPQFAVIRNKPPKFLAPFLA